MHLKKKYTATQDDHRGRGQGTLSRKMNSNEEQNFLCIFQRIGNSWLDSTKGLMDFNGSTIHQLKCQPSQAAIERANILLGGSHQTYLLSAHSAQVNCHNWTAVTSIRQYLKQYINSLGTQHSSFSSLPNKYVHFKGQILISS